MVVKNTFCLWIDRLIDQACLPLSDPVVTNVVKSRQEHGGYGTGTSRQGCVDGDKRGDIARLGRRNGKSGTGVESIPSEPQAKGSKELKRYGMRSKVVWLIQRVSIVVIKSTKSRSKNNSGDQGRNSSGHMDGTRSSQINRTRSPEWISRSIGQESVGGPKGVRNDWVGEADQKGRVQEIGGHFSSFGNGASDDGRESTGKGELKEPLLVLGTFVHEEKVGVSDKSLGTVVVATIRKSISAGPECQTSTTRVEQVPKNYVFDILGSDASSTKHSKASLHEIDKGTLKVSASRNELTGECPKMIITLVKSMLVTYSENQVKAVDSGCQTFNTFCHIL
jgi:hypothetical protein